MSPELEHEFEHKVLDALALVVPGFAHAYMHSPTLHAVMQSEIKLFAMKVELMSLGAAEKAKRDQVSYFDRVTQPIKITGAEAQKIRDLLDGRG